MAAVDLVWRSPEFKIKKVINRVIEILESRLSNNPLKNAQIFDALSKYKTFFYEDPNSILDQIDSLLKSSDASANDLAYGVYSKQFEEAIGTPYWEAIQQLSTDQKELFWIKATLGVSEHSMSKVDLLVNLLEITNPLSIPAFEKFLKFPDFYLSDSVNAFFLAYAGLAKYQAMPPFKANVTDLRWKSWELVGHLVFWEHSNLANKNPLNSGKSTFKYLLDLPVQHVIEALAHLPSSHYALQFTSKYNNIDLSTKYPQEFKVVLDRYLSDFWNLISATSIHTKEKLIRLLKENCIKLGDLNTLSILYPYTEKESEFRSCFREIYREISTRIN